MILRACPKKSCKVQIEENVDREFLRRLAHKEQKFQQKKTRSSKINAKTANCLPKDQEKYRNLFSAISVALKKARSRRPQFVLGKSKIKKAGRGVFVSDHQDQLEKGTIIPYPGILVDQPSENHRRMKFQVALANGKFLLASSTETPGQPLGCFVNRVMSKSMWKRYKEECEAQGDARPQNLSERNADLIVLEDICYLRLNKIVYRGEEILTTYGSGFKIVK